MAGHIDARAGAAIGPYTLEHEIGAGGFGAVWRARDTRTNAAVALKLLTGRFSASESARIRAEVELLAAAAITSPHVVRVLDGASEPVPYIVMELVEGNDLAGEIARQGRLGQSETLRVAHALALALADLERVGIVHRDIKPANVILTADGTIKLADFGIARIIGFDQMTAAGHSPMSMAYAAPEVWDANASHASDVYALGVLLFECLCGRPPFVGTPAEVYRQHAAAEPDLTLLPPDTTPALRDFIAACLDKRPEARPHPAGDLLPRVETAERELAAGAASPQEPQRFGPWLRRAPHPTLPWTYRCVHETSGETATVEVLGGGSLALGDELRRAVEANAALAPLGAERLLGTNRLLLRPGERWAAPSPGEFLFWVARDERESPTMPARISRDVVLMAASGYLALLDAADAAGLRLQASPGDLLFDGTRIIVRRAGLPPRATPASDACAALAAMLGELPVDAATRAELARVRDLASLREWAGAPAADAAIGVARAEGTPRSSGASLAAAGSFVDAGVPQAGAPAAAPPWRTPGPVPVAGGSDGPPAPPLAPAARSGGGGWLSRWRWIAGGVATLVAFGAGFAAVYALGGDGDKPLVTRETATATIETTSTATPTTPATTTPRVGTTPTRTTTAASTRTPIASATVAPPSDPDSLAETSPPAPGTAIQRNVQFTMDLVADVRYEWTFDANDGDVVDMRADAASNTNVAPRLEIRTANDQSVASAQDYERNGYVVLDAQLTRGGTYRLTLSSGIGSGATTVRFAVNPYRSIRSGDSLTADIGLPGDVDRYVFDTMPGDLIEVRVTRDNHFTIRPRIEVSNDFGDQLDHALAIDYEDRGYALVRTSARKQVRHIIYVGAENRGATGAYTIELNVNPGIEYALGSTVNAAIDQPEEVNRYRFTCTAGQRVSVTVRPLDTGTVRARAGIHGPSNDGNDAEQYDSAKPTQVSHTCRFSNTYEITVSAMDWREKGGYILTSQ